jgi:hypothetical protein
VPHGIECFVPEGEGSAIPLLIDGPHHDVPGEERLCGGIAAAIQRERREQTGLVAQVWPWSAGFADGDERIAFDHFDMEAGEEGVAVTFERPAADDSWEGEGVDATPNATLASQVNLSDDVIHVFGPTPL